MENNKVQLLKGKRITLLNGMRFRDTSYSGLVKQMQKSTWLEENKIEYMAGVARRSKIYTGQEITYTGPEQFVKELHRIGIITELEEFSRFYQNEQH